MVCQTAEKYKAQYAYIARNKEKYAEHSRKHYHRNKERAKITSKAWRERNKEYRRKKQRASMRARKLWAIDYLGGQCKNCQQKFHPAVYEFHHPDPTNKGDRDPSKMLNLSLEKLKNELDKCVLLCANCHRYEHHKDSWINGVSV